MFETELVELIKTHRLRGEGTEEKPYYKAKQFWTKDGELLWEEDEPEFEESKQAEIEGDVRKVKNSD